MKIPKRMRDMTASWLQIAARAGVSCTAVSASAGGIEHRIHDRAGVGERRQVIDGHVELRLARGGGVEPALIAAASGMGSPAGDGVDPPGGPPLGLAAKADGGAGAGARVG